MLQKYHPNPLSHFLALHNSQATATHNHVVDAHTLASTIANGHSTQFQQHHHQQHQHQQHQPNTALLANHHPQNLHNHHTTTIQLAAQHLNSHNSPTHTTTQRDHYPHNQQQHNNHQHQQQHNHHTHPQHHHQHNNRHHIHNNHHHLHHTQQLIEAAANTTLDAGKSFTIAAILGLQKSAMENTRKEYTNNVINLSLNGGSSHNNTQPPAPPTTSSANSINSDDEEQQHQTPSHPHQLQQHRDSLNNNNNRDVSNLNVNKSNICNSFNITNTSNNNHTSNISNNNANTNSNNTVNSFNCDNNNSTAAVAAASVLMNRYLPSAMVNVTGGSGVAATPSIASFATSPIMAHQQHARANSFVAAAAAAAAAAANGAPSALQSLQQLHQQHAHQTSLNFQREKLKSEHNSKKSSLKNKRVRTIFTPEQLERLEAEFERQQYMVGPERLYLAHTLQLTEAQVKVWFQNRRIKWRKHHLEITQQRLALLRQTQVVPPNANGSTDQVTINIDDNNDEDECDDIKREELREFNESRQDTESELSICNDSMDAESIIDGDDET